LAFSFLFFLSFFPSFLSTSSQGDLNPLVVDHMFGVRIDDLLHGLEETHRTTRRGKSGKDVENMWQSEVKEW